MPTRHRRRADPTEQAVEAALQPGRFIPYGAAWSFLEDLEKVAAEIAALVRPSPSAGRHAVRDVPRGLLRARIVQLLGLAPAGRLLRTTTT